MDKFDEELAIDTVNESKLNKDIQQHLNSRAKHKQKRKKLLRPISMKSLKASVISDKSLRLQNSQR